MKSDQLRQTGARIKFLSLEPLLGPLPALDLRQIDWVIVGGESGPGARPLAHEWVIDIQQQCARANVPFFFKQWGGVRKKQAGWEGRSGIQTFRLRNRFVPLLFERKEPCRLWSSPFMKFLSP